MSRTQAPQTPGADPVDPNVPPLSPEEIAAQALTDSKGHELPDPDAAIQRASGAPATEVQAASPVPPQAPPVRQPAGTPTPDQVDENKITAPVLTTEGYVVPAPKTSEQAIAAALATQKKR